MTDSDTPRGGGPALAVASAGYFFVLLDVTIAAMNNTSRQVGGAIGVALIGGLSSISTSLAFSAGALLLGGVLALALMGRRGRKPSHSDGKSPQRRGGKSVYDRVSHHRDA